MLQIERVILSLEESEDRLQEKAAAILGLPPREIQALTILRRAIDAREEVRLVYTLRVKVKNEEKVLRRCRSRQVSRAEKEHYRLPPSGQPPQTACLFPFSRLSYSCTPSSGKRAPSGHGSIPYLYTILSKSEIQVVIQYKKWDSSFTSPSGAAATATPQRG